MVKEIVSQPIQNQKLNKSDDSKNNCNIDFLELILKNIDTEEISQANIVSSEKQENQNSEKQNIDSIVENLMNLDEKEETDNSFKLDFTLNLKEINLNKNLVSEIKNIITSTLKQNNILLSKQEINQFHKIDSLKELLNFANQKGLNIETIKFSLAKGLNINNKTEIKTPIIQSLTQQIIDKKIENKFKKETENKISQKTNLPLTTTTKKVSLESILNNKAKTDLPPFDDEPILNNKNQNKIVIKNDKIKTDLPSFDDEPILDNKNLLKKKQTSKQISLESVLKDGNNKVKTDLPMFDDKMEKITDKKDKIIEKKEDSISNSGNSNINGINELKGKQILAKQVIKNFNQNLDEAIKNYKPPISKVDIELNPKNLGKVEVTIIQRGNNIQINMNTDQNNVSLFQTNQAEFKQALSNIGFSNIDMSFNSNQEKEKKQNQAKKTYKENEEFEEMGEIEIQANYQYA